MQTPKRWLSTIETVVLLKPRYTYISNAHNLTKAYESMKYRYIYYMYIYIRLTNLPKSDDDFQPTNFREQPKGDR